MAAVSPEHLQGDASGPHALTLPRSAAARAHWSDASSYPVSWAQRARFAARLIGPNRWVCDLGCGPQVLRWFLPRRAVYLPADLKRWTEDTELCDLNAGIMPRRSLELCDVCAILGVITYLDDPEALFQELGRTVERVLVSHFDVSKAGEPNQLWGRAISVEELDGILGRCGFRIVHQVPYCSWTLVTGINEHFDEPASRRRAIARSKFRPAGWKLGNEWQRIRWRLRTRRQFS